MDIELGLVTDPYACTMYIVSPLVGLGGGPIVAASACFCLRSVGTYSALVTERYALYKSTLTITHTHLRTF